MSTDFVDDSFRKVRKHVGKIFEVGENNRKFCHSIRVIRKNVLLMDSLCMEFISNLSAFDLSLIDEKAIDNLCELVIEVVSAFPNFFNGIVRSLVSSLCSSSKPESLSFLTAKVANLFKSLKNFNPMVEKYITDAISYHLPHHSRPKYMIENFYTIGWNMAIQSPNLRKYIFCIMFDGLIKIDCEISKLELEEIYPTFLRVSSQGMDMKQFAINSGFDRDKVELFEISEKLDSVMAIFLNSASRLLEDSNLASSPYSLFEDLSDAFVAKILSCKGLSSAQFIWFYLCSKNEKFLTCTLNLLWCSTINLGNPIHIRHMSAVMLSGLLSRSNFVNPEVVKNYIQIITFWLVSYVSKSPEVNKVCFQSFMNIAKTDKGFEAHHLYYVVSQSLFYCIIFQNKFITLYSTQNEVNEWREFLHRLDLERLIFNHLNPLLHCSPFISQAFSQLGQELQLFYSHSLVKRNERLIYMISSDINENVCLNLLNLSDPSNFPYDPYCLPSTQNFIQPIYRNWPN